jgi:hypothetical protein
MFVIITLCILAFVLMVVVSNILSAPLKIGQKIMIIVKFLYNIFITILKPTVKLIIFITRLSLFLVAGVFACVLGLLTFGFAFSPVMNLRSVLDAQLVGFSTLFSTLITFTDKNINLIEPIINRFLAYLVSLADFLYHSIKS